MAESAEPDYSRCLLHPEYTGRARPTGFPCARCWLIWITAESERYQRAEFKNIELHSKGTTAY